MVVVGHVCFHGFSFSQEPLNEGGKKQLSKLIFTKTFPSPKESRKMEEKK